MIKIVHILNDKKVNSRNIQLIIDIKTYVDLASSILDNNPFQRNKVSKSGSVYSLLKQDIRDGCIMPPIVLASTMNIASDVNIKEEVLNEILVNHKDLKILDGLQRTYSLIDVYKNNQDYFDNLDPQYELRIEIYLSISDAGILYRMLTLNTGQTPMTLRHQLEILFSKYFDAEIDDIKIIRDIDEEAIKSIDEFKFSDLIEGYNSFLEKNELPIDRFDILQTVKTIEFISEDKAEVFDFRNFVKTYHEIVCAFDKNFSNWEYPDTEIIPEEFKTNANPFGRKIYKIFNRGQAISGFGAAIGELIELGVLHKLTDLIDSSRQFVFDENDLIKLNKSLDDIREKSKKIGNGQRIFFKLFFKNLFDGDGKTFKNIEASIERARVRALAEV